MKNNVTSYVCNMYVFFFKTGLTTLQVKKIVMFTTLKRIELIYTVLFWILTMIIYDLTSSQFRESSYKYKDQVYSCVGILRSQYCD